MSDTLNEQISALIDGELPAAETELLLRRLEREPALRETLSRYSLIGAVLRGDAVSAGSRVTLGVTAALAAEKAHRPAARGADISQRILKVLGGLAVAATVAGVAIFSLARRPSLDGAATPPLVANAPMASSVRTAHAPVARQSVGGSLLASHEEPQSYVTPAAQPSLGLIPRAQLASYVVAHSEVSSPLGLPSNLNNLVTDGTAAGVASQ
jgi:anti-sigma factor RsiW